jgi:hypothetical protein
MEKRPRLNDKHVSTTTFDEEQNEQDPALCFLKFSYKSHYSALFKSTLREQTVGYFAPFKKHFNESQILQALSLPNVREKEWPPIQLV